MVQIAVAAREAGAAAIDQRPSRRRREILAAASRLFRDRGLQATGMREVAAGLGMAVGNLYYYFENKEDLLAFCQEDALAGLLDLATRVEQLDEPADARLYALLAAHVVRLNEGTPGSLAHLEVESVSAPRRTGILEQRRRYERTLERLVIEGVQAGVFRPVDARLQALALLGAVNWTVKWFRPGGRRSARRIGEEFAETLVRGLLASRRTLHLPNPAVLTDLFDAHPA